MFKLLIRNSFLVKKHNFMNRKTKKSQFRRSGFTLVELIVVMIVLSILLSLSVMGILAWQDWSRFKQQNEYAQNIFVAAQNQLNEYSANGKLTELYEYMIDDDSDSINLGFELTEDVLKKICIDENQTKYDPDALWPESVSNGKTDKKKYQNKIVSVRVDKEMYSRYQADPTLLKNSTVDKDRQAYVLFELIGSYIYDTSILEKGSICIEFTPRDGQVFSVFYSDYVDSLNYNKISDAIKGDWEDEAVSEGKISGSLIDRSETYRKNNMIGFYSVDTLYASTKNQIIQPKLTKVMLHNEETFYLTYKVSNSNEITQYLKYDIELFESKSKQERLKLTLDGTKIKNEENQDSIPCAVLRNAAKKDSYGVPLKDANGNVIYEEEGTNIGTFPILAYIDKDKTVHVIFDAADIQAQTYLYKTELTKIYGESVYADTANFARTYSFFRFGIDPADYYVSIKGYGTGFKDSIAKRSNIKNSTFESISTTTADGKTSYVYTIKNPRHLNNVRFIEDLAYEQQAQISSGNPTIDKISFELASNVNISKFQEDGYYYNTYSRVGDINLSELNNKIVDKDDSDTTISNVTNTNCEFPSFTRLRARDVFDGKKNDIIGYRSSEISNVLYGVYSTDITNSSVMSELKPVGLFNINYGEIKDLALDDLSFAGTKYIGGFSGINAGTLTKLKTRNTNKISRVIGLSDVGGIIGFQLPVSTTVEIKDLENRAAVEGVKAIGGILGMVRNEYSNLSFASLPGITAIVSEDTLKTRETKITIKDCSNYGIVSGLNKDEIKGVYTSDNSKDNTNAPVNNAILDPRFANDNPDDIEARYIGGIVGYCYNKYEDETKTGLVKIESCLSSPQMDDTKLISILQNKTTLKKKLKGVYIGGIAGYNHFCEIDNCSTNAEKGKDGYLFGYRYVGGIVGLNIGPASGIKGADPGKQGTNENHVIAYDFAGGITGCNANVINKDSLGNDISASDKKDPEKLLGLLIPDSERSLYVKIENWLNKGLVIATNSYSGGITGYNAGWIYGCNSNVEPDIADKYFATIYSGDYTGGISGYNNGIIGNTERKILNSHDSSYEIPGNTFSTICYVKGHNYVGGIVGYNDVDSIVEDYEVASGYVYGDDQSCFVGGYAGLNASLDLLMDQTRTTARLIHSNPNRVEGTYCVGGNIGGNIINTNNRIVTPSPSPSVSPAPSPSPSQSSSPSPSPSITPSIVPSLEPSATPVEDLPVYSENIDKSNHNHDNKEDAYKYGYTINFNIHNNTSNTYPCYFSIDFSSAPEFKILNSWNMSFDPVTRIATVDHRNWGQTIKPGSNDDNMGGFNITTNSDADMQKFISMKFPVTILSQPKSLNAPIQFDTLGADQQKGEVILNRHETWGDAPAVYAKYEFFITNNTDTDQTNWRIEMDVPDGTKLDGYWNCNATLTGTHLVFTMPSNQSKYDYLIKNGQTLTGVGGNIIFKNKDDRETFFNAGLKLYWGDETEPVFDSDPKPSQNPSQAPSSQPSVQPSAQPSIAPSESPSETPEEPEDIIDIYTYFKTDNFLGVLEGSEFVGGFVGYNLLFDEDENASWIASNEYKDLGGVYILQKKLIDSFKLANESISDAQLKLIKNKEIVDNLDKAFNITLNPSKARIYVSGKDLESQTTTTFGSVTGNIYVGGVLGYNDENTKLYVKNVENATPVIAKTAIPYESEQILNTLDDGTVLYRKVDYKGDNKEYQYSYAGGIIGKVTRNIIIDNCWNAPTGDVQTVGTYTGGLCEINDGQIINCNVSNFGSSVIEYIGGLCGLNKHIIDECNFNRKTVSGKNVVGGIAAENFGVISNIHFTQPKMIIEGTTDTSPDGVCGLFAAVNGSLGTIEIADNLSNINIVSKGRYVGAITGYNQGTIQVSNYTEYHKDVSTQANIDKNIELTGTISGYKGVGGFIGCNDNVNTNQIVYLTNDAKVTATHGDAGGIVGINKSGEPIRYCVNKRVVSATEEGNAGGITASNNSIIEFCYDYTSVNAPNGIAGGIAAFNDIDGSITDCYVGSLRTNNIQFVSSTIVGGIAAKNNGFIADNTLSKVTVTNYKTTTKTEIGTVVGRNMSEGEILVGAENAITDCKAIIETNECKVGGIAGSNEGYIHGTLADNGSIASIVNCDITLDLANYASIGGIVGHNTGVIENLAVDASIDGKLGSDTTGYGGIAGYSGYRSVAALEKAQQKLSKSAKTATKPNRTAPKIELDYPARIENCTFDGTLHAVGSSGQPARIGGITGYNMYGSKIYASCIGTRSSDIDGNAATETLIYAGKKDGGHDFSNSDFSSYAYLSGCAGENYGCILACENSLYSNDTVTIFGYGGETAGIAANNYGFISGYKDSDDTIHFLSTGKKWNIEQRFADNDHGPGGIVGIYKSTNDVIYIQNNASVTCKYKTNNKTGGIFASLEQYEIPKIKLSYVENYGDIYGYCRTGGFISQVRSKGVDFEYCKNFGNVYSESKNVGGYVGRFVDYTSSSTFMHCENHGKVANKAGINEAVGGFVGSFTNENKDNELTTLFYDCVNTGIIKRDGDASDSKVGNFVGEADGKLYLDYCRNYNTSDSISSGNGFVRSDNNAILSNCFNNGSRMFTDYSKTTGGLPFKGAGTVYNGYYLSPANDIEIDTTDYGVLADIGGTSNFLMSYNGMDVKDMPDTTVYLAPPSDSNYLSFNDKAPKVKITFGYDEDSQGIDGIVFYLANNVADKKAVNTSLTYSATPTYYYTDGSSATGEKVIVTSNRDYRSGEMVLKNPSTNKKPAYVIVAFDNNGSNIYYRGMAYIPAANTSKKAAFSRYLVDQEDVTYTISKVYRPHQNGKDEQETLNINVGGVPSSAMFYKNRNSDVLKYSFGPYENMSMNVKYGAPVHIYIDGNYRENAKGMKTFIFYLSPEKTGANNQVNVSDQYNYYYDYTVEFSDIDGKVYKTSKYVDKVGYFGGDDLDLLKSEQRIEIPSFLNPKITSIHIEIQYKKRTRLLNNVTEVTEKQFADKEDGKYTENGKVFLRGFKYIAEDETEPKLMTPGRTGAHAKFDLQTTTTRYTRLSVSHTEQKTTVYAPTNASDFSFDLTYPENNPVGEKYYKDLSDYKDSITTSKKSGSRIDVFYDLDPKLRVKMHALNAWYFKLPKPTNLKYVEKNGGYRLTWDRTFKADSYELYYEIRKPDGSKAYTSDVLTLGSQMTAYDVPIEKAWKENNYHIQFFVKAINGYHYAFSDSKAADFDSHYDKYDSDWASSVEMAIEKQALPTPKIHWEIVNGNRTTFVLDNYEEYEALGCTDCTIYFTYIDKTFKWDLSQEKYRKPEKITMGSKGGNSFFYKAVPNAGISNYFVESNTYRNLTEAHGNDVLAGSAEYTATTFKGFYGTTPEEMRYEINFKVPKSGLDTYQRTDISAYDKNIGATVVYNNEITHTANSSGDQDFNMTSVLKNIPVEWFDNENEVDSITVRAYPYHSQFDMVHYGHEVEIDEKYLPLYLNGTQDENEQILASIIDDKYYAADADTVSNRNVYNLETHDMNPGYLLMKQLDGTYEIFYSSVIDMSMNEAKNAAKPNLIYLNYDVAYRIYQNPFTETKNSTSPVIINQDDYQEFFWIRIKGDTYNNTKVTSAKPATIQELQTAPIFEDIKSGTEDGTRTYTVTWDKYFFDPVNYDQNNNRYSRSNADTAFGADYATYFDTWKNYVDRIKFAGYSAGTTYDSLNNDNKRRVNNAYWSSYSNAKYIATLYGKTFDGEEVQLQSKSISGDATDQENGRISLGVLKNMKKYNKTTTTDLDMYAYQAVFKDSDNEWSNYPYIFVRVIRLGTDTTYPAYNNNNSGNAYVGTNKETVMLPRFSQMGYDVQLKLNTISKPSVILKNEDGHFVTSSLEYTVKWGAITDKKQKDDLGGYLITVKSTDENTGENHTKPHYYYVNENQIHLVESNYADGILSEISADHYQVDGDNRIAYIDLSDFNTDEIVSISVKAIAKESPTYFGDGEDGVENEITIPDRLVVPDVSMIQLISDQATDGGMRDYDSASCTKVSTHIDVATGEKDSDETLQNTVDMSEYIKGISFAYDKDDPNYLDQPTAKISLAIAVFDQIDTYGRDDISNHDFGDFAEVGTNQWNKGAYKTLYSKENSLDLGYVASENVSNINLLANALEEYPGEFAGKWLKIVAKAESSTRIDSQWTDQDLEDAGTINACWIHIPKLLLDDVSLKASDCADSDTEMDPVHMYQTKNGIEEEIPTSGTYTTLDIQALEMNIDPNVSAYTITSLGKMRITDDYAYTPVHQIILQKSYDSKGTYDHSWDVYLKALGEYSDLENAERIAQEKGYEVGATITLEDGRNKIIPECVIDNQAIYVGNISDTMQSITLNDLYALLGSKEDATLSTKLEFVADNDQSSEMFRLILPDILAIDGNETTRLKDSYIGMKRILVQPMLSEVTSKAHICGHNVVYRNIAILQDDGKTNIWQKQLQTIDQKDYDAFFEELEKYFEQEKLENEKPSEDDSVSANSL